MELSESTKFGQERKIRIEHPIFKMQLRLVKILHPYLHQTHLMYTLLPELA